MYVWFVVYQSMLHTFLNKIIELTDIIKEEYKKGNKKYMYNYKGITFNIMLKLMNRLINPFVATEISNLFYTFSIFADQILLFTFVP